MHRYRTTPVFVIRHQFNVNGYNLFCNSCPTQCGGEFVCLVAEIAHPGVRLLTVLCVYGTLSGELPCFLDTLGEVMCTCRSGTIIASDLNINVNPSNRSYDNKNTTDYFIDR